jgi:hypothetical protein
MATFEGVFTIDDAENDGLIKRHCGKELAAQMRQHSPQLFQHLLNVAEEQGRDPWEILGDGVVRALNDESFSQSVVQTQINMSEIEKGQMRIEDAEFLQEFSERLGLDQDDDGEHWMKDTIKDRLKATTETPIPRLSEGRGEAEMDEKTRQELQSMRSDINRLVNSIDEQESRTDTSPDEQNADDVFGSGESESTETEQD